MKILFTACNVQRTLTFFLLLTLSLQITHLMDQFERQFEHLDVQTQTMDEAMSGATTLTVPEVCTSVCVLYVSVLCVSVF